MNNTANITLTAAANAHICRQLELTQAAYLRLGVKESGCNGYMYMLDFLEHPEQDDVCFDFTNGVKICVRNIDLDMVQGTEVDIITEGLNSALVFKNPNATSYCGCGESFAVASETEAGQANPPLQTDIDTLATNVGRP